jgi:hypothetical protein
MAIISLTVNVQMALTPFCASSALLIYQFKSQFKPHILGLIGVFVRLQSQLLGMYVIKLNN